MSTFSASTRGAQSITSACPAVSFFSALYSPVASFFSALYSPVASLFSALYRLLPSSLRLSPRINFPFPDSYFIVEPKISQVAASLGYGDMKLYNTFGSVRVDPPRLGLDR